MKITGMRLAILSILVVLAQPCSGKETEIDWTRCNRAIGADEQPIVGEEAKPERKCFVPHKCRAHTSKDRSFEVTENSGELPEVGGKRACEAGMQIKPYGRMKWLVYMQVTKEGDEQFVPTEGVWLQHEQDKYFGCKNSSNKIEYQIHKDLKTAIYPLAEQEVTTDRIFCAFYVTGVEPKYMTELIKGEKIGQFMVKTATATKAYNMPNELTMMARTVDSLKTCDPDDAMYDNTFNDQDLITRKIPITEKKNNKCTDTEEKLYVKDSKKDSSFVEATDVECKFANDAFKFAYTTTDGKTTASNDIDKGEKFHVHCAKKACLQCTELELPSDAGSDGVKSTFVAGDPSTEECAKATCGKGQPWEDNWEYADSEGMKKTMWTTVTCKKHNGNPAWMMKNGDSETEVKSAWCSKKINCASKNPLNYKCPADMLPEEGIIKELCTEPNMTTSDFGCGGLLKVRFKGDTVNKEVKNLTCNENTGNWEGADKTEIPKESYVFCPISAADAQSASKGASDLLTGGLCAALLFILIGIGLVIWICVRRHRKYTESEKEQRVRPRKKSCCMNWFYDLFLKEKLITDDLSMVKEWNDSFFETVLRQWMKFSVYERKKFSERIGFELGVTSTCEHFFKLFNKIFEVETDYRIWQGVVPVFKLLHAQATDKENNLDTDKRMRKWCISLCKPIIDKLGWDGCNNEWRDTAYQRYQIMNLLYYCEDKDFIEKLLEFFDKGQFHGLHSINRQVAWAAAIREKDQFEAAKAVAETAFVDKAVAKRFAEKRAAKTGQPSSGGKSTKSKTKSKTTSDAASGASDGSAKGKKAGSKEAVKGGSKESKSTGSKEGSKSKSGKSNRSNKSKKDKKGSKETPSGKAKKGEGSKESSHSSKKGGSKEAGKSGKGKSREKAGADDSGKEKKEPASDKNKNKSKEPTTSDKDKKTKSGKDKKDASGKDKKDKSGKSGKDKKGDKSGKSKKEGGKSKKEGKSLKEKTAENSKEASKSGKSNKSKKSSKDKQGDKSGKSKSSKEAKTAIDKTATSAKSKKSTKSMKRRDPNKPGVKERKDADGDKLHGDRAQHIFFAIGSSRSKEQIASFLDYYIDYEDFDASNLVYLFAATLEWDDTRSYGLDLFLNMNKKVFKKMPPGDKYHMRILKNFRRYVIGELDLQKIQDHMVNDPNYTAKHYSAIELSLMLKRIQNNVTFQPKMIDQLDEALKKLNF